MTERMGLVTAGRQDGRSAALARRAELRPDDPEKLWESNIFGKSLHELVNEGLQSKLLHMPQEARTRLQETLERVINEGCTGLICILI